MKKEKKENVFSKLLLEKKEKNEFILALIELGYTINSAKWYYYKLLKKQKNETN